MENSSKLKFKPDPELKLMGQVRQVLRYNHYAYRNELSYCGWTFRYIDVKTTEIHTHVMAKDISAALSPLDNLS